MAQGKETYAFEREYDALSPSKTPRTTRIAYAADGAMPSWAGKLRPSIHMPRKYSRLTLEVLNVRVGQLQCIERDDCIAEGIDPDEFSPPPDDGQEYEFYYRTGFRQLWDSINAKRGHGWLENPWVWCITFKRMEPKTCAARSEPVTCDTRMDEMCVSPTAERGGR